MEAKHEFIIRTRNSDDRYEPFLGSCTVCSVNWWSIEAKSGSEIQLNHPILRISVFCETVQVYQISKDKIS